MRRCFAYRSHKLFHRGLLDQISYREKSDSIIEVEICDDHPAWATLAKRARMLSRILVPFHYGYSTWVEYEAGEIEAEQLLQFSVSRGFQPNGLDAGTIYDDNNICRHCRSGRVQRSLLHLNYGTIPRAQGFSGTNFESEWICSEDPARRMMESDLKGIVLSPAVPSNSTPNILSSNASQQFLNIIKHFGAHDLPTEAEHLWRETCLEWQGAEGPQRKVFQLLSVGEKFDLIESDQVWRDGIWANDLIGAPQCRKKHVVGVGQVNLLRVRASTLSKRDFQVSSKVCGSGGLYERQAIVSSYFRTLMSEQAWKGAIFDKIVEV